MSAYESWTLEASSADPDDTPVWVDLTPRVRTTGTGGQLVRITRGRMSERDDIQPSTLAARLGNNDHALTPDNPSSALPWWGQGRKLRLRETADGQTFYRFTGYAQPTDIPDWAEPNVDQQVNVNAVDLLGRLDRAPVFRGTLAEHIRAEGSDLVEWFPLDDADPHMSAITAAMTRRTVSSYGDQQPDKDPEELIVDGGVDGPLGDDASYAQWSPASDADGDTYLANAELRATLDIPVGTGDVLTVSAWLHADAWETAPGVTQPESPAVIIAGGEVADGLGVTIRDYATLRAQVTQIVGGVSTTVTVDSGRRLEREAWRLVTVRLDMATGAVDLWSGADLAASGTGVPQSAVTLTVMQLGQLFVGAIGHVQIRVGAEAMTYEQHVAQHRHGWRGLQRQTVAERIATLAGFVGVDAADLDLDPGASTPMQVARLAGQKPAAAMRAAAATEGGGRLLTSGEGPIVLQPRQSRYGQPVTRTIPYRWIGRGLRMREAVPINYATASRVGGGETYRTDADSVRRYGVGSARAELDTAIDADPANWASWTVRTGAAPRARCSQLILDLLPRTEAERATLLGIEIGDRIEITDLPATAPTGVGHLIVEGITDEIGTQHRRIVLNTSPLLGEAVGEPPYCPIVGDLVGPTAVIAY